MLDSKRLFFLITLLLVAVLALTACNSGASQGPDKASAAEEHDDADEHAEEAEHSEHAHSPDDHMAGMHNVPEEAAAVPNPIAADEENIVAGAATFATTCAVCHGAEGHGDGPGAAGLEKPPANLTEGHVQELSDGALFYIISHGKPETPMPAWENTLDETQRWQVVNFLRTLE